MVENSIITSEQGDASVKNMNDILTEIVNCVEKVVDIINDISKETQTQAISMQELQLGVEQISAVVQTNSAISEESAAASEELSSQANILNSLVVQFKLAEE